MAEAQLRCCHMRMLTLAPDTDCWMLSQVRWAKSDSWPTTSATMVYTAQHEQARPVSPCWPLSVCTTFHAVTRHVNTREKLNQNDDLYKSRRGSCTVRKPVLELLVGGAGVVAGRALRHLHVVLRQAPGALSLQATQQG